MKKIFLVFITIIISCSARGQDLGKQIVVSPAIGDTLWPLQREKFRILPTLEGFRWAVFYLSQDSIVNIKARLLNHDGTVSDSVIMTYGTLVSLQFRLNELSRLSKPMSEIYLSDDQVIRGTILDRTGDTLVVQAEVIGTVKIPRDKVTRIVEENAKTEKAASVVVKDPNETRAFIMPTGNTLAAGKAYVGDYELFFFTAAVGVTNWLMVNGGFLLLPISIEDQVVNYGLKARLTPNSDEVNIAVGLQMFSPLSQGTSFGIGYGVASFGNAEGKASIAFGKTFSPAGSSSFVIAASGDKRVSGSMKLLFETWIIQDSKWFPLIIGVRFFGSNLSGDLGLLYPIGENISSPIGYPVANVVYTF
ncbi:MAG: hypothetical protein M1470_08990 [Bacteroidetes bacterium]|nr:hypothetical protein [Bacteroidota bacterium]MCL5737308.1 hypothetical protein [Bacteroidota bacterium]